MLTKVLKHPDDSAEGIAEIASALSTMFLLGKHIGIMQEKAEFKIDA